MSVSEPFIRRPIATSLLGIALMIGGALGYWALPVSALPQVDFPTVQVTTQLPGASPDVIASLISDEELELGMRSLAVPVRDVDGSVVGAVSVSAFSARVSRKVLVREFLVVLEECAKRLEERCFGRRFEPLKAGGAVGRQFIASRITTGPSGR